MENLNQEHKINMPEELLYLIIKRFTNTLKSDEASRLDFWINSSPENEKLFNEISDIWLSTATSGENEFDSIEALQLVKEKIEQGKSKNKFLRSFAKIAALILLLLSIGGISYYFGVSKKNSSAALTEIAAPFGSRTKVTLPDGTKVWLNGGSTLKFSNKFNSSDRIVSIVGEGYFDVTHNENLPFIVNTKEIRIKVLGTAFNIKAYPEEGAIETTLERGSLAIEKLTFSGNSIPQTVLEPNQRATFIRSEGKVHLSDIDKEATISATANYKDDNTTKQVKEKLLISKQIDTQIFTSWKDNKLVFRNEPFESLTTKLERWYGVYIKIEDEEINNYHFNGTFEKETIQDVLNIIHFALPIKYNVYHDQITISLDKSVWKESSKK